ncbi:hypothetical protein GGR52DRAFT_585325 [Hypoxylon sp. FL1284]|nr:hypothetical protein GGR52DRAFT_585325 [Hypoxylon sp. FL1284]
MSTIALPGSDQPDIDRGPQILAAVISTTLAALVVVTARLYDYTMIAAMGLSLAGLGVIVTSVEYGAGRHAAYLDTDMNRLGLFFNFVSQPLYLWAIPMVKMSAGLFLLRISPNIYHRRILQGFMTFVMAYTLFSFLTLMLQCTNLAMFWDTRIQTTCWPQSTLQGLVYSNAAAIIKTAFIINYGKTEDFLWDSADVTIWVSTETNAGIIAACLPCTKPMFKNILDGSCRYGSGYGKDEGNLRSYGHGTGRISSIFGFQMQTKTEIRAQAKNESISL